MSYKEVYAYIVLIKRVRPQWIPGLSSVQANLQVSPSTV